jgi:hypothetical protein
MRASRRGRSARQRHHSAPGGGGGYRGDGRGQHAVELVQLHARLVPDRSRRRRERESERRPGQLDQQCNTSFWAQAESIRARITCLGSHRHNNPMTGSRGYPEARKRTVLAAASKRSRSASDQPIHLKRPELGQTIREQSVACTDWNAMRMLRMCVAVQ